MPNPATRQSYAATLTAMITAGAVECISQVVLFRELMIVAGGNELSLGLAAAGWLAWAALGGFCGGRLGARWRPAGPALPLILTGATGIFSLWLVRLAPGFLGIPMGHVHPLGLIMVLILGALLPAGLMAGANFPLILAAADTTSHRARLLSRMYGWEALGGTMAGLLFALALVYWLNPVGIIMSAAWLSCLAALICHPGRMRIAVFLCLALASLGLAFSSSIDRDLKNRLWAGRNLVAWAESPYAQLAAARQPGQMDFFASGSWLFSHPDRLRLERAALLPLLAAPHAREALFLGGGPSRIANEAARRGRLQHVTALELDPWLWRLAQEMPPLQKPPATMRVVFDDGRAYLKNTPHRFDLVVVDMPPPSTVQNNRYYTEEGFQALARVLNPKGVAVVSLPGVEYLVGRLQAARLNTILIAAKQAFAEVVIMSGPELR
ncbi:MAG: fused MFS/spermidine synthase, partial [Desulfarculaceae bacterium]